MIRVLKEFRIRGVKTNIGFLINVLKSQLFVEGHYNVNFIDEHPELFNLPVVQDRGTKLLKYIGDTSVNGYAGLGRQEKPDFEPLEMPQPADGDFPNGTKQLFDSMGAEKFSRWIMASVARALMTPVSTRPPTRTNKPAKKKMASHSTLLST